MGTHYNEGMAKTAQLPPATRNSHAAKPAVSELGRKIRRLRQKIQESGEKMLSRRELEREIAERRGSRR